MSLIKRLFGGKPPNEGPTPEEVMAHAIKSVKAIAATTGVERRGDTAVMVQVGDRAALWNLADVIQMAPKDSAWREGVITQAQKVVAQLRGKKSDVDVPVTAENVVVLVWPQAKLDALGFDVVAEPLVPGLAFFYGVRCNGKMRSVTPDELKTSGFDLVTLRAHALANLAASPKQLELGPLQEGAPIITNHVGYACAASLLADTSTWQQWSNKQGPLLVAVPTPSRLFIGPDEPAIARALRQLARLSLEIEDEILTADILRFDGATWSIAPPPPESTDA